MSKVDHLKSYLCKTDSVPKCILIGTYFPRDEGFNKRQISLSSVAQDKKVFLWGKFNRRLILQAFLLCSFTSNGDFLNILPIGLLHCNINMGVFKRFPYFCEWSVELKPVRFSFTS